MNNTTETIDPSLCPLCQQDNRCGELSTCGSGVSCWCRSPEITFSDKLLNQVPSHEKGKACICKACTLANV